MSRKYGRLLSQLYEERRGGTHPTGGLQIGTHINVQAVTLADRIAALDQLAALLGEIRERLQQGKCGSR
jgi:hypothetical protein